MTAELCVKWNDYPLNILTELDSLRTSEDLVDVTLSCDGQLFKAHKLVLSMCSPYFRNVFMDNPCKHPVVILKNVNQDDVKALLNYVYQGTVYMPEKNLASFLCTAELLQIKGLAGGASTINTNLESTQTSLEKNSLPALQQFSTNNNKVEKQETSTSTVKPNQSPDSPNDKVSVKQKKCLPDNRMSTSSSTDFGIASTPTSQCTAGIPQLSDNCTVCDNTTILFDEEEYLHTVEKSGLDLDENQKQADPQKAKQLSIRQCILPFIHHCQCRDANCRSGLCQGVKRVILHVKSCKMSITGTCPICKRYINLCVHHAKYCTEANCSLLFCPEIKEKLKQQLQQRFLQTQLLKRRMAMMNTTGTLGTENTAPVVAVPQHNIPIQPKMIPHNAPVMVPKTQLQSNNDAATLTAAASSSTAKANEPTSTTNDNQNAMFQQQQIMGNRPQGYQQNLNQVPNQSFQHLVNVFRTTGDSQPEKQRRLREKLRSNPEWFAQFIVNQQQRQMFIQNWRQVFQQQEQGGAIAPPIYPQQMQGQQQPGPQDSNQPQPNM